MNRENKMAQYTVTGSCGHDHTVRLYGPGRDRESKLNWYTGRPCPDCYQAANEKYRGELNVASASLAAGQGLPPLVGSEKQLGWAETVRQRMLKDVRDRLRPIAAKHFPSDLGLIDAAPLSIIADRVEDTGSPGSDRMGAVLRKLDEWSREQTAAGWWIDHRDNSGQEWLKLADAAMKAGAA